MNDTKATGGGGSTFLKILGFGCGGCLLLILVVGVVAYSMLPTEYDVERSIVVDAPMEVVFPLVDTPKRWADWDPWSEIDPGMTREYKGPPAGVGAESHWDSANDKVGAGMFRLTESRPGQHITFALEFKRPFESQSTGTFDFEQTANGVRVVWGSAAELDGFMMRVSMGLFADQMLGTAFESGLSNLKELAEKEAGADGAADMPSDE